MEPKTSEVAIIASQPQPTDQARRAVAEHAEFGNSIYDPRTGKNLAGSRNISVGIAPEHASIHDRPPTPQDYDNFHAQTAQILAKHANSAVRTTHDQDTGLHHIEVVGLTPSKPAAMEMAQHLGEKYIFDHVKGKKISTGIEGREPSHLSIDQRFEHLRRASPKREDYSGVHYSDKSLKMIEGSRRGAPPAKGLPPDSDAQRVRLGTKTGQGVDAPAGFYSHQAGSIPDVVTSAKPHAYSVRGQFAFGSVEHPAFQQGYANGVQHATAQGAPPPVAHQLGLNNAENAMQDHGFDGYFSPKHPAIKFHFGDSPAAPVAPHEAPEHEKPKQKAGA